MNGSRYTAASIELRRSQCAVAGLREVAAHKGDSLQLRGLDELRNRLATLEHLLAADRLATLRAGPAEAPEPDPGAWAQPSLALAVAAE